ncbi:transposase [Streptomyces wuyuanensis]
MIAQHLAERDRLTHGGPHAELVRTDHPAHPTFPVQLEEHTRLGVCHHAGNQTPISAPVDIGRCAATSKLIDSLKSVSSRYLRAEYTGRINRIGMGSVFWSRSYFAGSCGGAPLTVIRQYVEGQKRPV